MFKRYNILFDDDTEGGGGSESVATPAQGGTVQTDTSGGFSFDDFKGLGEGTPTPSGTPARTQDGTPESDETQTSTPTEEPETPTVAEEGHEGEIPATTTKDEVPVDFGGPRPVYPEKRDYSGIDPAHVKYFKNMKNESFAALKPIYQEWKSALAKQKDYDTKIAQFQKETAPKYHYDHPEAYILSDDYRSVLRESATADQALQHLGAQLKQLRLSEPWVPIAVDNDGNLVKGEPQEPSAEGEAQVLQSLARLEAYRNTLRGKMDGIQTNFKAGRQKVISEITTFQDRAFNFWDKLNEKEVKEYEALKNDLPAYLKNTDYADVVAKSLYTAKLAMDKFNEMAKKQKVGQINAAQQQRSGSVKSSTTGNGGGSRDPWDTSDFDRMKAATR